MLVTELPSPTLKLKRPVRPVLEERQIGSRGKQFVAHIKHEGIPTEVIDEDADKALAGIPQAIINQYGLLKLLKNEQQNYSQELWEICCQLVEEDPLQANPQEDQTGTRS